MKRVLENKQDLLDHAEEARNRAEQMSDAESKSKMFGIAERYEKLARRAKFRARMESFNPQFDVQVTADSMVITLLGTIYSVTYYKRTGSPGLLARDIANKDDHHVSMSCPDFLVSAWRTANDRARRLGWIG